MNDPRLSRLDEPHVRPLMELVQRLRQSKGGIQVPNVDPDDGGVNASVLFLLETPGPRAVNSGFVSRSNSDPSARNMGAELDRAGFLRPEVVLWNVVPHYLSTETMNKNASLVDVREAATYTQVFIDLLPMLRVIVLCGRKAQHVKRYIKVPEGVHVLSTFHPSARSYSHPHLRSDIQSTFLVARRACLGEGAPHQPTEIRSGTGFSRGLHPPAKALVVHSMLEKAKSFLVAAVRLRRHGGDNFVAVHLWCQGLELLLKALLLFKDYDAYIVQLSRRFRHDLVRAADEVTSVFEQKPMRPALRAELQGVSTYYKEQRWRYGTAMDIFWERNSVSIPRVEKRTKALLRLVLRTVPPVDWQW